MVRRALLLVSAAALIAGLPAAPAVEARPADSPVSTAPEPAQPGWANRIDKLLGKRATSVAVGDNGSFLYQHKAGARRAPASNEKLMLSLAIMDLLGPDYRIATQAASDDLSGGVVDGDLWILGHGNPQVGRRTMSAIAKRLVSAGIDRINGSVRGSEGYFDHDWMAPGWKRDFPQTEVALPSALAFENNTAGGRHIRDPEKRAAAFLTKRLRSEGVRVVGKPRAGDAPGGLDVLAEVNSASLEKILRAQNIDSINFYAETLGKVLGVQAGSPPGTIKKGAAAIEDFAHKHGADENEAHDASGLSYDDRVTAEGVVRLLWYAEDQPWGGNLQDALPKSGQGTLSGRLRGVTVRAKTGTLTGISALSGWVKAKDNGDWIAFSILSRGIDKTSAIRIEDRIVQIIAAAA